MRSKGETREAERREECPLGAERQSPYKNNNLLRDSDSDSTSGSGSQRRTELGSRLEKHEARFACGLTSGNRDLGLTSVSSLYLLCIPEYLSHPSQRIIHPVFESIITTPFPTSVLLVTMYVCSWITIIHSIQRNQSLGSIFYICKKSWRNSSPFCLLSRVS